MTRSTQRIVVFGEVLYDVFPDGESVLGGAALNVAWNLKGLGLDPLFVSRVGDDERGERVLATMRRWGMDTSAIQIDGERPTGVVRVSLHEGSPSFEIVADQAYDFIDASAAVEAVKSGTGEAGAALLYHGTLAARAPESRGAMDALRARGLDRFVDVNLRAPWWELGAVLEACRGASVVKVNDQELVLLAGEDDGDLGPAVQSNVEARAREFREDIGCELLVVTRGPKGALAIGASGEAFAARPRPLADGDIEDTVGAGDAFSAKLIAGLRSAAKLGDILDGAVEFARSVCMLRGATSTEPAFYRD